MEWKPLHNWEGMYEISDTGIVKNVRTGRYLKNSVSTNYKKGVRRRWLSFHPDEKPSPQISTHVAVLESHVSPRPKGMYARFKDGDTMNPTLGNLEWGHLHSDSLPGVVVRALRTLHSLGMNGMFVTLIPPEIQPKWTKEYEKAWKDKQCVDLGISKRYLNQILRGERRK